MDAYENEDQVLEPVHTPDPEPELFEETMEAAQEAPAAPVVQAAENVPTGTESPVVDPPYVHAEPVQKKTTGYAFPGNMPRVKKKSNSGRKALRIAAFALSAVLVIIASVNLGMNLSDSRWSRDVEQLKESFNDKITALEEKIDNMADTGNSVSGSPVTVDGLTPGQVYAMNKMSVVAISCSAKVNQYGQIGTATSSGSGFVLTDNGYVITNYHVIEDAELVNVVLYDGTEFRAMVVGYDANNDLAVLKVEAQGLQPVKLGASSDLIIGDMVVAIGNPLGELTSTQTVGYISGKDRDVSTDGSVINMLQTDAAINPGNSGGPLFNMKGEVIGITTAKYSGTTSSGASIEGIGFAIPIDDVTKMISDIMTHGYVTGAYLGVSVVDLDEYTAAVYGLPMGARVAEVVSGSCAEKAGVRVGDIIIGLGDHTVRNYSELAKALRRFEAGQHSTITVYRSGAEMTFSIIFDEKPNGSAVQPDENGRFPMPSEGNYDEWYNYFYGQDPQKP